MIVHFNGKLMSREEARVSPFDRGFLFGDGVYEGLRAVKWGAAGHGTRIVGLGLHIARMQAGLNEAGIRWDALRLGAMSGELLRANGLVDAFVYWQVTRGEPGPGEPVRARVPGKGCVPTVFGYCTPQPALEVFERDGPPTRSAVTLPDIRWQLGHLQTIAQMGNVLCALKADAAGCDEAILIRGGEAAGRGGAVAEGLATNVVVVGPGSGSGGIPEVATPGLDTVSILAGVTRAVLLRAAPEVAQRRILAKELERASEVLVVGTTTMVTSVTKLDGRIVGEGRPGPTARRLLGVLIEAIRSGRDDRLS